MFVDIYSVNLRIQSKCAKIRTRKTPDMDTFYAMLPEEIIFLTITIIKNFLLIPGDS